MHLALHFLGPFRATLGGEAVLETRAKKIEALLVFLAVEAEHVHRRERLVGLLFPEMPEEQARSNLRQTLTRLRRSIHDAAADPPYLLISREATQFNLASDHFLDVSTFRDLLEGCERHAPDRNGECAECMEMAAAAASLYGGPFLDGFFIGDGSEFDDWVLALRQEYQEQALAAMDQLATYHERRGEYVRATEIVRRQMQLEPWREEGQRQLMRLLAYQGQREAALKQYQLLESVLDEELGIAPLPETRSLRDKIMATADSRPYQLPQRSSIFIGRDEESAVLRAHLANPNRRLITLFGSGGSGKTALALEVGWQAATQFLGPFPDGVFFVPLAGIVAHTNQHGNEAGFDPLATAVAEAIGFAFSGAKSPRQQLLRFLHGKSLLLLLDNLEHMLPSGLAFLRELLEQTTAVKVLVTSRERLGIQEEWVIDIAGLPYPQGSERVLPPLEVSEYPAVQLFTKQSQRVMPSFVLAGGRAQSDPCTLREALQIVQLVQGLPLAIELAASWVRMLSCGEIVTQIERSMDFLKASTRDRAERHQSLRAVFDYSWEMLEGEEQETLRRLSVFHGQFDVQAATVVTGASLTCLSSLLDSSWLRRHESAGAGTSEARFEFLEVLRQFAAEKLAENERELYETRQRHAGYFMDLLADQNSDLGGGAQIRALQAISRNIEEFRAAWRWAAEHLHTGQLTRGLEPLSQFYYMRSWFDEGAELFALAASTLAAEKHNAHVRAIWAQVAARQGWFMFLLGQQQAGRDLLVQSAAILRETGPQPALVYALNFNAATLSIAGDYASAETLAQEARALSGADDDPYGHVIAHNILSQIAFQEGDLESARRYCEEALAMERAIHNKWSMGFSLTNLGRVALAQEDFAAAQRYFQESLDLRRSMEDSRGQAICLRYLGNTAAMRGAYGEAQQDYEQSLAIFREIGSQDDTAGTLNSMGWLAVYREDIDAARDAFLTALAIAHEATAVPRVLDALAGLVPVEARSDPPLASQLAQAVAAHPAASFSSRAVASEHLHRAGQAVPGAQTASEDAHATSEFLDQLVSKLLLEQQGS